MMQACDTDKRGLRMRAMIAVLYRAGPKISEALALRVGDVNLEHQTLHFSSSAQQADRVVGMDGDAFAVLAEWLAVRQSLPGELVFCSRSISPTLVCRCTRRTSARPSRTSRKR